MKVCKVKPKSTTCRKCLEMAVSYETDVNCEMCDEKNKEYELLQLVCDIDGNDYAFILREGEISKVKLHRVFDVKEKGCIF